LHAEIAPLIDTPEQTIVYCGSGAAACQQLLAMEVAQLRGAALYPGSWSERCADRKRPVETFAVSISTCNP
jgi:thiosulfate/3-mercaptopyruvate sulfurtransferase